MAFKTSLIIGNGCPIISVSNGTTYDAGTINDEANFTKKIVNVTGMAYPFTATIDFLNGDSDFNAPDCPNILKLKFIQVPIFVSGIYNPGDVVYDPFTDTYYQNVNSTSSSYNESPQDWSIITEDQLPSKYFYVEGIITYCNAFDVYNKKMESISTKLNCFDDNCCKGIPCDYDFVDAMKYIILAFDTYYVGGRLGAPDVLTQLFIDRFKRNLDIFKKLTNMNCDGLYAK